MKIGYARVSSLDQNLDRQLAALKRAGVKKIYEEKKSGKDTQRSELKKMLDYIHDDDEVIVLSLDRLGRNSEDLTSIIEVIRKKGAVLNILDLPSFEGIQDKNLKALLTNLVLEIQKFTAESERTKIRERQKQGIEIAKQKGLYRGGKKIYSESNPNAQKRIVYQEIVKMLQLRASGDKISIKKIADDNGVARGTVYSIQKELNSSHKE